MDETELKQELRTVDNQLDQHQGTVRGYREAYENVESEKRKYQKIMMVYEMKHIAGKKGAIAELEAKIRSFKQAQEEMGTGYQYVDIVIQKAKELHDDAQKKKEKLEAAYDNAQVAYNRAQEEYRNCEQKMERLATQIDSECDKIRSYESDRVQIKFELLKEKVGL